jgi:integrase
MAHKEAKRKRSRAEAEAEHPAAPPAPAVKPRKPKAGLETGEDGLANHSWVENRAANSREMFRFGKWTKQEDAKLLEAFEEYCTNHALEGTARTDLITEKVKGTAHSNVAKWLAARFPQRTLRSVWARAVRLLHPGNFKGKFTSEEQAQLLELVEAHGKKWKEIGRLMGRLPMTLVIAHRNLTAPSEGKWTAEEVDKLTALCHKYGRTTAVRMQTSIYVAVRLRFTCCPYLVLVCSPAIWLTCRGSASQPK